MTDPNLTPEGIKAVIEEERERYCYQHLIRGRVALRICKAQAEKYNNEARVDTEWADAFEWFGELCAALFEEEKPSG